MVKPVETICSNSRWVSHTDLSLHSTVEQQTDVFYEERHNLMYCINTEFTRRHKQCRICCGCLFDRQFSSIHNFKNGLIIKRIWDNSEIRWNRRRVYRHQTFIFTPRSSISRGAMFSTHCCVFPLWCSKTVMLHHASLVWPELYRTVRQVWKSEKDFWVKRGRVKTLHTV